VFQRVKGNKQQPEPIKAPAPARQQPTPTSTPAATPKPAAASPAPAAKQNAPSPSGRNVLSSDVEIKGSIKFSNDLVVDGKIEGEINSDGSLTVGENARIQAKIKTRSVVIYGKVYGSIEVSHNVELKANCELVGDIKAASLSIEPGAIFVGKSTVGKPTITPQASAPASTNAPAKSAAGNPAQQPVKAQQPAKAAPQPAKIADPKPPKHAQQELSGLKKPGEQKPVAQKPGEQKPAAQKPMSQPMGKAPQPIKRP
jgi:cytoskeletal protein CcmA (bactofilin family)